MGLEKKLGSHELVVKQVAHSFADRLIYHSQKTVSLASTAYSLTTYLLLLVAVGSSYWEVSNEEREVWFYPQFGGGQGRLLHFGVQMIQ